MEAPKKGSSASGPVKETGIQTLAKTIPKQLINHSLDSGQLHQSTCCILILQPLHADFRAFSHNPDPYRCASVLFIGSTGKERTDDDGHILHEGEMWIKKITSDWKVEHIDWRREYNTLRWVRASLCG